MASLIDLVFRIFELLILARVIISLFRLDPYNQIVKFINQVTDPFILPVQKLLQQMAPNSPLDFSPLVVLVIAFILENIVLSIIRF